jgi:opacity protein-like surface antigen
MNNSLRAVPTILLLFFVAETRAAEPAPPAAPEPELAARSDLFQKGAFEAAFNNGVLFSPFLADKGRPTVNYTLSELQLGYMLTKIHGSGLLRGDLEIVGELFGSYVFAGPGDYIFGGTLWGRYNFVPRSSAFVPYLQAGAGLTSTDIDRDFLGQPFNFNLNLGAGVRCFIAERWALSLEFRYQHISNCNTAPHNLGINAQGPMIGLSYLF